MAQHDEAIEQIRQDLREIKQLLTGNGNPDKGIIVRLDRLEQSEHSRKWTIRAITGAVISLIVSFIWKVFTGV